MNPVELPSDDPSIDDGEELLRRIPEVHVIRDENRGGPRPTSAAFEDDGDGGPMSVYLTSILTSMDRPQDDVLRGHPEFSLAAFETRLARSLGLGVLRDPLEEEQAHGVVVGRKTHSIRKRLALGSRWVVLRDGPPD